MQQKTKIGFYTHFVKFTHILPKHQAIIKDFAKRHLVEKRVEKVDGRFVTVFGKIYVARTADKVEIRIHRNYWPVFKTELLDTGIVHLEDLEIIEYEPEEGVDVVFTRPTNKSLRDYQEEIVEFIKKPGHAKIVELAMGKGKGLSIETEIKTKKGKVLLADLKLNDQILTPSGEVSTVIQITDNGKQPCFCLTTEDDRTVICDNVHLWKVRSNRNDFWEVIKTEEMLRRMLQGEGFYLPRVERPALSKLLKGKKDPEEIKRLLIKHDYPFKIDRGALKINESPLLRIKSLKYVGMQHTKCIQIDHPEKLFIVNNNIVTHNTFTSLSFAADYGKRLAIMILGRYTERWWDDIDAYANKDEIVEIRGMKDLIATLTYQLEDPNYLKGIKIVLITTTTVIDYIKHYENLPYAEREHVVPPELIWGILGIGLRINDEAHQHFYANFMIDLYTHIPKTIALSATLKVADSFLSRMYNIVFPKESRIGGGLQTKYTDVTSVRYRFKDPGKIRCRNRKKMYNHTEFEKWLLRTPKLLQRYFKMITVIVQSDYVARRQEKQKCLVFFATKKMCSEYVKYLHGIYPSLKINRYISEDSYENLLKSDIAVSTLGSSGTAVDIPNLITTIMTTALKSEQANLQALGRLRELPDTQTRFFYLVCDDIDKHQSYHFAKRILFRDWVKSHQDYYVGEHV